MSNNTQSVPLLSDERRCCFIPCDQLAKFEIWAPDGDGKPYDHTDACSLHAGELMDRDDAKYFEVRVIESAEAQP